MAVAPPIWNFVLTALDGTVLGEITNADERQVVLPLNRLPTASFKVPLAHPLANSMIASDCLVKAYRWDRVTSTRKLVFCGPILTAEEQADRDIQTLTVNAVGPFWRLTKRLLGTTKDGFAYGTVGSPVEVTNIAKYIVDTVNGGGYTGIQTNATTQNTPPNMTKIGSPVPLVLANPAELIAQLSATVNGFDYEVVPVEPTTSGFLNPTIGSLTIAPTIGQNRPDAIFDYGSGTGNMVGYNRLVTRENMMTTGYITAPNWPDLTSQNLLTQTDSTQLAARGLFEDAIQDGGLSDDNMRLALLAEHIKYRCNPREIINITLANNARPWYASDWVVGDTVRARAAVKGTLRFDAMFRIWGATFAVDKNGNETVTLELVMPAP